MGRLGTTSKSSKWSWFVLFTCSIQSSQGCTLEWSLSVMIVLFTASLCDAKLALAVLFRYGGGNGCIVCCFVVAREAYASFSVEIFLSFTVETFLSFAVEMFFRFTLEMFLSFTVEIFLSCTVQKFLFVMIAMYASALCLCSLHYLYRWVNPYPNLSWMRLLMQGAKASESLH